MAGIAIRSLDDEVKTRMRVRASGNEWPTEEETRLILRDIVAHKSHAHSLAAAIRARMAPLGGLDLELPPWESARETPTFDEAPK